MRTARYLSVPGIDGAVLLLQERGRDAAQRVLLNTPHPLTVLSDPRAYGNNGTISRHHNPFNYLRRGRRPNTIVFGLWFQGFRVRNFVG